MDKHRLPSYPDLCLVSCLEIWLYHFILPTTSSYYTGQFCNSTDNSGPQVCFILVSPPGDHPLTFSNWVTCREWPVAYANEWPGFSLSLRLLCLAPPCFLGFFSYFSVVSLVHFFASTHHLSLARNSKVWQRHHLKSSYWVSSVHRYTPRIGRPSLTILLGVLWVLGAITHLVLELTILRDDGIAVSETLSYPHWVCGETSCTRSLTCVDVGNRLSDSGQVWVSHRCNQLT